uniref:Uncharacterized protein n=1 Tax=Anguilla anguilla TaxID=7936 RepID=A0A0E9P9T8_ANGAN
MACGASRVGMSRLYDCAVHVEYVSTRRESQYDIKVTSLICVRCLPQITLLFRYVTALLYDALGFNF